ncbi:hypothetical protein QY97_02890 [Bacillus thermotolerans]|nr:hypothetical protein [Bacillus thermotolerans]KKB33927.1 hypothetical protein QY97_02890 [Bacillus thermotolerans]KKB37502.1 hypothetical protein QY96_03175 [Bacillus thermotolerans]
MLLFETSIPQFGQKAGVKSQLSQKLDKFYDQLQEDCLLHKTFQLHQYA